MSLFTDVDPSNVYLNFVRAFQQDKPLDTNLLFVFGDGSNGKTTLFRAIEYAFPFGVKSMPLYYVGTANMEQLFRSVNKEVFLIKIVCELFRKEKVKLINSFIKSYPGIGFIIEGSEKPPNELNCISVNTPNHYRFKSEFKVVNHVDAVRNAITTD